MKFHNINDKKMFLLEVDRMDLVETIDDSFMPDSILEADFITRRTGLMRKLRDFRKSQNAKKGWRNNKHKIMNGIKRFHKSSEGKKMHRKLGKFLSTRVFRDKEANEDKDFSVLLSECSELLKSISSLKTHLFIEAEYYAPIKSQLVFEELLVTLVPELSKMEHTLLLAKPLTNEQLDILIHLVDTKTLLQEVSICTKVKLETIQEGIVKLNFKQNKDTGVNSLQSLLQLKEVI